MDQALSQLFPIQKIGQDGFNWWVGKVEGTAADEPNNKGGMRYKVRIVGEHPNSFELLPTADLPWCNVMMPVNVPFMPGNEGGASSQLVKGCWVVGFYLDPDRQKPIIMGSIGQTPGATTIVKNARPDDLPFTTAIPADRINPAKDGKPAPENPQGGPSKETNRSTGGVTDGTKDKNKKDRVPVPPDQVNDKRENWCQSVAEKCTKTDLKTKTTNIISELLAELQSSGGNIGDVLVNKATGGLYSAINTARRYTNKLMAVVRHFIAKIKGFMIEKLKAAVNDLIKALLYPSETGNVLTPVTEFFNKILKNIGCQMADLGDRLAEWLTNVLMDLVTQIYQAAACQIDLLVNGILSKINSLLEELFSSILGPLQDILGAIAGPLNIIGGAINYVLSLLGISCSGPDQTCSKYKKVCTTGNKEEPKNDKDFLDNLLSDIDNLFPVTGADYTQYTCDDAYSGSSLEVTTIGFSGGILSPDGKGSPPEKRKIVYTIDDIVVEEAFDAVFTVTRSGYTQIASSVEYKTLTGEGSATSGQDYYAASDILGFAPNETSKKITIKTFYNTETEPDEDFFVQLSLNSPSKSRGIKTEFIKNIGKCTITERDIKEPGNPYVPKDVNPYETLPVVFPPPTTDIPISGGTDKKNPALSNDPNSPSYKVEANRSSVREGEFVVYTITTSNVKNGTIAYYVLTGVSNKDILGNELSGKFTISNNSAKVTIGIADDEEVENIETLTFSISGTGASTNVLIIPDPNKDGSGSDIEDYDEGIGDSPLTSYQDFTEPSVDPKKIITDQNGGIISIPVDKPGSPYREPPYVFIGGEGIGATAFALLDEEGFLTEIRVASPGYGYKKNISTDSDLRCIIDAFTLIRPGIGYTTAPDMYVNGKLGIAEAIINDDGFVIGARILDRTLTFEELPEISLVGGGGYGAKLIPALACLDTEALVTVGSTKIGTGRYIDCP